MSFNTFGKLFRFTTWGESHGPAIGCVVDGCPPNINIKEQDIQLELNKRKAEENKILVFDAPVLHRALTSKKVPIRYIVNFNYFTADKL